MSSRGDCDFPGAEIEAYVGGQLSAAQRQRVRQHMDRCRVCFERVVHQDPSRLFALLSDQDRPQGQEGSQEERWEGFWPAILEGIGPEQVRNAWRGFLADWLTLGGRIRSSVARWTLVTSGAVVLAVIAMVWLAPGSSRSTISRPSPPFARGSHTPQRHVASMTQATTAGRPSPQTVERVRTSDSRDVVVYSMVYYEEASDAGVASKEPAARLVLIVDGGLKP